MFKNRNLLVLSHTYNSFIKDPVEILAKEFNKVYVLVRYQPIAELSRYIPLPYFKSRAKYSKKHSIDLTNKPKNVEIIPVPLWYLPFKSVYYYVGLQHANAVLKMIKKKNITFDMIHAHFGWSAGYAGMKVKEKYNKPLVVTGHGYDVYDLPFRSERARRCLTEVFKSANELITVSEKNNKYLKQLGIKNAHIIPNGYVRSLFYFKPQKDCRKKLGLSMDKKIILTIGNLEKVKGYEYLIEAINMVKAKYPDVLCLHIGGGPLEGILKQKVKSLGLESNYKFLGKIPHDKLVDYFGACDIFALSSLNEGNPTVMFETLGCGKPFIGTNVGGIPDVITSSEYGLLTESKNSLLLSKNILKALDTKWNSDKIIKYSAQYSWENICKEILKIYKAILE